MFTALSDPRFGAGGTFNTNGNQSDIDPATRTITDQTGTRTAAGTWGGFNFMQASSGSIDNAYIAFAGGQTPIEGGFDNFNTVEIRQAKVASPTAASTQTPTARRPATATAAAPTPRPRSS